jgi:hypothetical protein
MPAMIAALITSTPFSWSDSVFGPTDQRHRPNPREQA